MNELIYAPAAKLAQAIRNKEVSSQEVVQAHIRRIEEVNPKLNAVVQLLANSALTRAREADSALAHGDIKGPLHGVPVTIKDVFDTAGIVSAAGTRGRASYVPTQDATAVARLRAAGAIVLGKTNMPEIALAPETDNLIYGRTNNPYDLSRTCGGSSGGEAAIIAAGGSPLGIGSDSGGSIRIPSHFCGIAGIKPTAGRAPRTGHFPSPGGLQEILWHVGPMARFVDDLILTLPLISGVDWRDPETVPMPLGDPKEVKLKSLKGAFHTDNGIVSPTSETAEAVKTVAKVISDAGILMEEACPEGIEQSSDMWFQLSAADGGAMFDELLRLAGTTETHPLLQHCLAILRPHTLSTAEFSNFLVRLYDFRSKMISFLEKYDVIICPVVACPAMPHGFGWRAESAPAFSYVMSYNLTGWPVVVVRAGASPEGLPIGVQVVARPWREDVSLAVAKYIETVLGGWAPPPL